MNSPTVNDDSGRNQQSPTIYTAAVLFGGAIPAQHTSKKDPLHALVIAPAALAIQPSRSGSLFAQLQGPALGIALWDPVARLAALGHFLLPSSRSALTPAAVVAEPGRYVDSGLAALFERMAKQGGVLNRMIVTMAGGGQVGAAKDLFQVGTRNVTAARKVLWMSQLLISKEDVGGVGERTLIINTETGDCMVEKADAPCAV